MPASLTTYFERAIAEDASDVHLVVGEPPALRKDGALVLLENAGVITDRTLRTFLDERLTADQRTQLDAGAELDLAWMIGGARFRANVHRQRGVLAVAARSIPARIPTPEEIQLEESVRTLADLRDGLVLVTGPAGCGKSTTLAVLIEHINRTRRAHVITIEDPIEFLYTRAQALIEQREIGSDTATYATALRTVLRQDPNVILVGEMRDHESVSAALVAAETGHLVLSTLHTPTAADTVERVVALFPAAQQSQVLVQLASVLRAVVAQRLLPRRDGGRVAAREVMLVNPAIATLIREQKIGQIPSVIQTSKRQGMQTMAMALERLRDGGLLAEGAE